MVHARGVRSASDLPVRYDQVRDQVRVVTDASVELDEGDIVALIGSNGAGKKATLRAITGLARIASSEIVLDGRRIDGLRPDEIASPTVGIGFATAARLSPQRNATQRGTGDSPGLRFERGDSADDRRASRTQPLPRRRPVAAAGGESLERWSGLGRNE